MRTGTTYIDKLVDRREGTAYQDKQNSVSWRQGYNTAMLNFIYSPNSKPFFLTDIDFESGYRTYYIEIAESLGEQLNNTIIRARGIELGIKEGLKLSSLKNHDDEASVETTFNEKRQIALTSTDPFEQGFAEGTIRPLLEKEFKRGRQEASSLVSKMTAEEAVSFLTIQQFSDTPPLSREASYEAGVCSELRQSLKEKGINTDPKNGEHMQICILSDPDTICRFEDGRLYKADRDYVISSVDNTPYPLDCGSDLENSMLQRRLCILDPDHKLGLLQEDATLS